MNDSHPATELRDRDLLCFSHDWGGDPLSKTHIMRLLAKRNRVLWVNSIGYRTPTLSKADVGRAFRKLFAAAKPVREAEPNLHVLSPLVIPAHHRPRVRAFNAFWLRAQVKRAMKRLNFRDPINWVFNPAAAPIANTLGEEAVIYYCVDEYTEFAGVEQQALARLEQNLLEQADLVLVSAERLYESKAKLNPHTVLVRHGVDYTHFRRALDPELPVPPEIASLPKPVLGFFGLIAPWVDVELLARLARHYSTGSLVMVGNVATDVSRLKDLPNVHMLGRKPYDALPAYCRGFDVALVPFEISKLTLNANPLKAREYLAAGLPVVSTDLPEIRALPECRVAADFEGFVREVDEALHDPGPGAARGQSMRAESWEARLRTIEKHLMPLLDGGDSHRPVRPTRAAA